MLVLSRREGERIVIGERIVVTVVKVDGARVKIGIEAPHETSIRREELPPHPAVAHLDLRRTQRTGESPLFAECC
jgi:carbon storage regulator